MLMSLTVAARTQYIPAWTLQVVADAVQLIGNACPASAAVYKVCCAACSLRGALPVLLTCNYQEFESNMPTLPGWASQCCALFRWGPSLCTWQPDVHFLSAACVSVPQWSQVAADRCC